MYSILIIDDDHTFCDLTARYLKVEGFKVTVCHEPQEGFDKLNNEPFDLILLDIMLPKESGFDLLTKIREYSTTPVVMCSALAEDIHEIVGLESGADDYVKKSAHPRVMLAKINSVLRRSNNDFVTSDSLKKFCFENLEIDLSKRLVMVDEKKIDLTTTEFNVLVYLIDAVEEPKSKKNISLNVLGKKLTPHDRSVDIHISRLRAKLGNRPNKTARIKTVQGFGYQLNTDV